jgi:site-specific recombinase XerD
MKQDPLHYPETTLQKILLTQPRTTQRIIALAYATGSRVSELNQITPEDIIQEEEYLHISCKVLKKRKINEKNTKRIALVRIDEIWLIEPIQELINSTEPHKPLVPLNRFKIYYIIKKATGLNPHMLRSIRATHLAQKGFTAHQLKHFFGWSSVSPSDAYVKLNVDDLRY